MIAYTFLIEEFGEKFDTSYIPICKGSWCTYSSYGWMILFEKNDEYYILESNVECDYISEFNPTKITYEEAIQQMIDWEEFLD